MVFSVRRSGISCRWIASKSISMPSYQIAQIIGLIRPLTLPLPASGAREQMQQKSPLFPPRPMKWGEGWGEGKWSSQFGDLVSVFAGSRPNRYRCHHTRLPRSLDSYPPSPCLSPQAGRGNKCSRRAPCYPLAIAECGTHTRLPRSLDSYAPSPCLSPQAGRGNKCSRRAPCSPLAP